MINLRNLGQVFLAITVLSVAASCIQLSDRQYVQDNPQYRGVKRVVVFLQRWPGYLQLSKQNDLSADFIKKNTNFLGPWEPAAVIDPRALDIRDIDDTLIGEVLLEALTSKGYQPFLAEALPGPAAAPL